MQKEIHQIFKYPLKAYSKFEKLFDFCYNVTTTLLHCTCVSKNLDIVKFLISKGKGDINALDENDETLLHIAAREEDNFSILQYLVELNKTDIDSKDLKLPTPFLEAARFTNSATIEYLSSLPEVNICSADIDEKNALHYLSEDGEKNNNGQTPYMIAKKKNNDEIINLLKKQINLV